MTDEQQPELRWAPVEPRPRNRGRVWLIIGLIVAAIVIVGVLLFFLIPRSEQPAPPESSPSSSPSPSAGTTTSPSASPSEDPTPVETVPALNEAAQQIDDRLVNALSDLDYVSGASRDSAASVLAELQDGAQRISDSLPGAGVTDGYDAVSAYSRALKAASDTIASGGDPQSDLNAAARAIEDLRALLRS
jgi:cytoskeletal protein RodZ